ncbi:OB-fold domain-containing protein [Salinarchaeum sp. IM2453]|uniref:Zn-ribbon domain-containing OB-fold protein n=1 Tax=Salinarchaeum sp. IM2453 TaxID=2862870 RepID=UPI001C83FDAE|nr:OB-fold domain-containing protein [Salinarchaeum sp. IM2453]QZA88295.1 OB-fold domain-containing protein [Salinarchaeum sp. IM2453]
MSNEEISEIQEFFSAIENDEPYYLSGTETHGMVPPRYVDPASGNKEISREPMPNAGKLLTYSEVHVAPSPLEHVSPYTVAIAEFGSVRITGQLRGFETDPEIGQQVKIGIERLEKLEYPLVVFTPK